VTRQIGIFGAAGFGREVAEILQRQLATQRQDARVVFVERNAGENVNGLAVVSEAAFLADRTPRDFIVAIADGAIRKRLFEAALASGALPFDVQAASTEVSPSAHLGAGHVLCGHSSVSSNAVVGRGFHLNVSCYLAHDCRVGDFVTFGPNVVCAGNVIIEDGAYIGGGALIRQGRPGAPVVIGAGAVVGMGAVVLSSVAAGETVVGTPARNLSRGEK
jgi:sugar O-acyltransferase (sialic acid O-acetyltransferase NeuD family)